MKLSVTFDLPDDLTMHEVDSLEEDIKTHTADAIERMYEYRGKNAAEQVAASMKVTKSSTKKEIN